jgi:hypothetical protein
LHQIHVPIRKEGDAAGNYVVQLVPVPGGQPAHAGVSVLAASTIAIGNVNNGDTTLVATFADTPIVEGQTYAVVVNRLDGGNLLVHFALTAACSNGPMFFAFAENPFFVVHDQVAMLVSVFVI